MIFVPYNVASSKNSKIATSKGVFHSKAVKKYLTKLGIQKYSVSKRTVQGYARRPNLFQHCLKDFPKLLEGKKKPYLIGLHFVRDSKRKADFHNLAQIVMDLLVAHGFIEDDDMTEVFPIPMDREGLVFPNPRNYFSIDRDNPGVYIKPL